MRTVHQKVVWSTGLIGMLAIAANAGADVFTPVTDLWIRESDPPAIFEDDLISVWASTSSDGAQRLGAIQWDISGFTEPITTAVVELFDRGDTRSRTAGLAQRAFLINPPDIVDYSYEEYVSFDQPSEVALEGLGAYDITPPDEVPGYQLSDAATSADVAQLETRRTGNGLVTLILKATAGERDWGDVDLKGTPPRLYLNEVPVVCDPGDWAPDPCDGVIDEQDFAVITDNWLQTVEAGTLGDHNFDGIVNLEDFHIFKGIFQEQDNGGNLNIPEPGSVLLVVLISVAVAVRRGSR